MARIDAVRNWAGGVDDAVDGAGLDVLVDTACACPCGTTEICRSRPCAAHSRTGKGGAYYNHVCNQKATSGASNCSSKAIREDRLDHMVLDGLLRRVLEPSRLKLPLADLPDRSDDTEKRRGDDIDRVYRERIAAEARLRRLLELVEEG